MPDKIKRKKYLNESVETKNEQHTEKIEGQVI